MYPFLPITIRGIKLQTSIFIWFIVYISICVLSTIESSNIGIKISVAILLSSTIMIGMLIFGKIGKIVVNYRVLFSNPSNIFKVKGLVSYGGITGVAIAVLLFNIFYSLPLKIFFQFVSPTSFWVGGIFRLGCFFSGCCVGKPTDFKLGIKYYNSLIKYYPKWTIPEGYSGVHPFGLYESILCFISFPIFFYLYRAKLFYGRLIFITIATYCVIRFCTEFFRDSPKIFYQLTLGQIVSLFLFLIFTLLSVL